MQLLKYKFIRDRDNLQSICKYYPNLQIIKTNLRASYADYVLKKGTKPIRPIAITEHQKDCLQKAYTNTPAEAGLAWIKDLHIHGMSSCPLCGGAGPRTIDHYLPQAHYPEFSVFSLNLLPSCSACNTKRSDCNQPENLIKTLHPYFDEDILKNLNTLTNIKFKNSIPRFEPGYNRSDYNEEQQLRIDEHLDKSIDETSFFNYNTGYINALKYRTKDYNDVHEIRKEISKEQIIHKMTGSKNSWGDMLCTGLLKLEDSELAALLIDNNEYHILRTADQL